MSETFEDGNLSGRGWYDFGSTARLITPNNPALPASSRAMEFAWSIGASVPSPIAGMRRGFTPTPSVYIRYYVRYSANWVGSRVNYHPHEFLLMTNLSGAYQPPAISNLTAYVEHVYRESAGGGVPVLLLQDSSNIPNASQNTRPDESLVNQTETRAVNGCNGDLGGGRSDCYWGGDQWRNSKGWEAPGAFFQDTPGPRYKNNWHRVEAYFQLNTIGSVNGQSRGLANGVVRYWFDGELIIESTDVVMRTARHPNMQFNQLFIGPYIGVGSSVNQSMQIDDLVIATERVP